MLGYGRRVDRDRSGGEESTGMETIKREIDSLNIVVLGAFNPAIFQPLWMAKQGLVRDEEAEAADVAVIAKNVTNVGIGPFRVQVEQARALFEINDIAHQQPLEDLVVSLSELLPHVPVRAVGFNRHMHYAVGSKSKLDKLGFELAPQAPWAGLLGNPEMRVLVTWGRRDGSDARFQVQVEPSQRIKFGLFVSTNEEYLMPDACFSDVAGVLRSQFSPAVAHALKIGTTLAQRTQEQV